MNWLSLLGLEGLAARWRANLIEGAIAAEDRMDLARLEWADLKQRLQQLLVLTILVAGLTVVALIMVSLAVLVHFWDSPQRTLVVRAIKHLALETLPRNPMADYYPHRQMLDAIAGSEDARDNPYYRAVAAISVTEK